MQNLSWYKNRFSSMSARDVLHRAAEPIRVLVRRLNSIRTVPAPSVLKTDVRPSVYGVGVSCSNQIVKVADEYLSGSQKVLSADVVFQGRTPKWNRDPRIANGKSKPKPDIKYVWELNRHLTLPLVSIAFNHTGQDKYRDGIRHILTSWIRECQYLSSPNWTSSLEVAIRLINWSIAAQILDFDRTHDRQKETASVFDEMVLDSVYRHVQQVAGHYSLFSSANNHLTGEAAGVYIASRTWPYWSKFERWGRRAKKLLIQAARDQTFADGVNREQAVWYLQFVLDFFILAGLAGRRTGDDFPDDYWRNVQRMLEFAQALIDAGGNLPMVGDADDGVVLRLSQEPDFCPFRSLLATGAVLFDRPDFAASSGRMDDKTRILVGEGGFDGLLERGRANPADVRREFPDGGYYILGQNLGSSDEIRMLVDAGPLGYLSIAAHGHADALAIYLSVSGREFLIDPGTYCYNSDPEWRAWFRGTRAHNTVTVDGLDQSVQGGTFMWIRHARASCMRAELSDDNDRFSGEHDGYERLGDPVTHRRDIQRAGNNFEIVDTLTCGGQHRVEQWWHFAEQCRVTVEGRQVIAENGGARVRLSVEAGDIQAYKGSDSPKAGWISRSYDIKYPTTAICVSNRIAGTAAMKTLVECSPTPD